MSTVEFLLLGVYTLAVYKLGGSRIRSYRPAFMDDDSLSEIKDGKYHPVLLCTSCDCVAYGDWNVSFGSSVCPECGNIIFDNSASRGKEGDQYRKAAARWVEVRAISNFGRKQGSWEIAPTNGLEIARKRSGN